MPDSVTNPGRWVYYDVNLDVIKEEIAKNVYLGAKDETYG